MQSILPYQPVKCNRRQLKEVTCDNDLASHRPVSTRCTQDKVLYSKATVAYLNPAKSLAPLLAKLYSESREGVEELAVNHGY